MRSLQAPKLAWSVRWADEHLDAGHEDRRIAGYRPGVG
jgi:hypothetical protein